MDEAGGIIGTPHGDRPSQIQIDRRHADLQWAIEAPEVLDKYMGEYVVPFERQIVAHGTDLEQVLNEAAQRTGKKAWELTYLAVTDPLQDIPH